MYVIEANKMQSRNDSGFMEYNNTMYATWHHNKLTRMSCCIQYLNKGRTLRNYPREVILELSFHIRFIDVFHSQHYHRRQHNPHYHHCHLHHHHRSATITISTITTIITATATIAISTITTIITAIPPLLPTIV